MSNSSIFNKLNARIITPYVDNNIWRLKEKANSITPILSVIHESKIKVYYPDIDVDKLLETKPSQHEFLFHLFNSYIFKIKNAVLEPDHGWVILGPFSIFKFSFPMVNDPWDQKKRRPSTLKFISANKKEIHLEEAISIKYGWQNYYHFFIDTLSQLFLLEENGIPDHIPVVVPNKFPSIKYVQEFLKLSSFVKRRIIIQKTNEYYYIKNLILCKDTFHSDSVFKVIASIDHLRDCNKKHRLFIFRPLEDGRAILNFSEIQQTVLKFGFIMVDSSKLTMEEQIVLFSGASEIIGVHGAGLTNIIFRSGYLLKLLEIFPGAQLTPEHYKNLSQKMGFKYSYILGDGILNNNSKNFNLSKTVLEGKMTSFFNL